MILRPFFVGAEHTITKTPDCAKPVCGSLTFALLEMRKGPTYFTSPKKQPVGSANVAPTAGLRGRETLPRRLGELVHWVRKGVHVCVGVGGRVLAWPCLHYKIPTILPRPLGSSWPTLLSSIASWRFVSFPTFLGHGCPLSGRPTPWFALGLPLVYLAHCSMVRLGH